MMTILIMWFNKKWSNAILLSYIVRHVLNKVIADVKFFNY
ncbi:hypothetical protein HMPREF1619_03694 [Klebsiella pneumoniae 909957]|nr:hypothetical protein HMPREF1619_03694 [Klebsiella pneumoniae 909957]